MNYVLQVLCQTLISFILLKTIYFLIVPKPVRVQFEKLGNLSCSILVSLLNAFMSSINTEKSKPQKNTTAKVVKLPKAR